MMRYKYNWLFAAIASALLAGCALAATLYVGIAVYQCSGQVESHLGQFQSKDVGMRAAIRKLASEVQRCPEAESYRVTFLGPDPDNDQGINHRSILYYRGSKTIGYEHDPYSGISSQTYVVDEAAIQAVAERGGTLDDFKQYDQQGK